MNKQFQHLAIGCTALLAACGVNNSGSSNTAAANTSPAGMAVAAPGFLLQSRMVDRTQLRPVVTLSNGNSITMQKISDNGWSGTINVLPGREYNVSVLWIESISGRDLDLARLEQTITVGGNGSVLDVDASQYSTNLDFDNDGQSNLAERENASDPFIADGNVIADNGDTSISGSENQGSTTDSSPPDDAPPTSPPERSTDDDDEATAVPGDTGTGTGEQNSSGDPESDSGSGTGSSDDGISTAIADVIIPRIASGNAPDIDGENVAVDTNGLYSGEWSAAVQFDTGGTLLHINNLMIDNAAEGPDGSPYRRWAAMHDGEYLYVLVAVDDVGSRFRDSSEDVWQDDSVEVFLDGDNSKFSSYGDDDDFHIILPLRGESTSKQSVNSGGLRGPFASLETLDLEFTTGPGIGPRGIREARYEQDIYEIRIELDSAGIETNQPFGFELQINDDDDGAARDSKWGWAHPSRGSTDVDNTYTNPSFMGTAILE